MEDYKCSACGEEATEGFALGRLCYYCISDTVEDYIKSKKKKEGIAEGDLQIGEVVETIFSGGEKFEVYDIRTVYSQRERTSILEYKLNANGREDLKTAWYYREQIIKR